MLCIDKGFCKNKNASIFIQARASCDKFCHGYQKSEATMKKTISQTIEKGLDIELLDLLSMIFFSQQLKINLL